MARKPPLLASVMNDLFPPKRSKAQERKVEILEAAIRSYTTDGIEKTTPGRIAEVCGVSRPLVLHYFPDSRQLFETTVRYIRACFQDLAIRALQSKATPREKLAAYVDSTFEWTEKLPRHAKVWLLFFYYCSIEPRLLALHSELVAMGHERIRALIRLGEEAGQFNCRDPDLAAKMIQVAISGALLAILTETSSIAPRRLRDATREACLRHAGAKLR